MCTLYIFENSKSLCRSNGENPRLIYTSKEVLFFSSPEHEVLMVSYCDQSLSVVRALSTFCFKRLLLENRQTDFEIILQEGSLGDPLPKLLKPFRFVEQNGRQS